METLEAIFEGGVFRPIAPVELAENSRIQLRIVDESTSEMGDGLDAIYAVLDQRYNTGISDLAARHNEHQP